MCLPSNIIYPEIINVHISINKKMWNKKCVFILSLYIRETAKKSSSLNGWAIKRGGGGGGVKGERSHD